jgi:PBSX family phage terminase large subunit
MQREVGGDMPRARDPNRDKAYEIYKSNPNMELTEIASQLNIPVTTVRSWKSRDEWERNATQRNATRETITKPIDDGTKETMLNENLTHEQRLFCIYYSKSFNAVQSYMKAYNTSYENACGHAHELWKKVEVKKEVERLNELKRQQIIVSASDLVDKHMRIAFANITDYLYFGREEITVMNAFGPVKDENGDEVTKEVNYVKFRESSNMDTELIQEVKQGRDGVSIKMYDAQKSMDWLEKFFLMNPMDKHKMEYDRLKMELEYKKMEPEETNGGVKYNGVPATMIAPAFAKTVFDIAEHEHNEYVFPGGRGSTKSSFISLEIVDLLEKNPEMHAAVFRQVGNTLRDSVYAQMCWAISALGLEDEYKCNVSPLEITKKSTGQKIFFRGNDDPMKSKGIKAPALKQEAIRRIKINKERLKSFNKHHDTMKVENGYIGILWFEELDQFKGAEAVRTVTQSVVRGGEKTYIFKSFNPPKSANNWANKYIKVPKPGMLVTLSNYLDVPKSWLGKPFLDEAEHLKETNPTAYENEYMGVANGTGGNVFDNVTIKTITDDEIAIFDRLYFGVDWGWYPDPWAFNKMYYNANQHKLYILDEDRKNKTKNEETARILREEHGIGPNDRITCDSAEQKSVNDYKDYGLFARGAIKGPGSVEYSMKWLASLAEIIIDNSRTPHTATEFLDYEYDRDKEGNIISGYPDKNNHQIDAIRYALEEVWKRRGQ